MPRTLERGWAGSRARLKDHNVNHYHPGYQTGTVSQPGGVLQSVTR
ncbi:hypothetical protein BN1183_CH_01400 [Pantoea ananatis]|nr:hypothetical protein BN1183_CH_01400 [Pantoea ananatis]